MRKKPQHHAEAFLLNHRIDYGCRNRISLAVIDSHFPGSPYLEHASVQTAVSARPD